MFTDGGGEFVNVEIDAWYQQHDIPHITTPPSTSRFNMVELTHQTLGGMMRSMMKESGLPTSFWVDARYPAIYVKNRSHSSAIDCIPHEVMWDRKPDIHHLRKYRSAGVYSYERRSVAAQVR